MQRRFLSLAVVFLSCLAIPANLNAQDTAEDYFNRAKAREDKGEYDKAIADFNEALAINPKYVSAYHSLGWLHATCPDEKYRDGKKAFENANKACQLDGGKHWYYNSTLAAAYAEGGEFEKAKQWEAKAIELAATDKSAKDKNKQELRSRLELYNAKKPYRQEAKKK